MQTQNKAKIKELKKKNALRIRFYFHKKRNKKKQKSIKKFNKDIEMVLLSQSFALSPFIFHSSFHFICTISVFPFYLHTIF